MRPDRRKVDGFDQRPFQRNSSDALEYESISIPFVPKSYFPFTAMFCTSAGKGEPETRVSLPFESSAKALIS